MAGKIHILAVIHAYGRIRVYIHTYIHTCIHTYIHTYIYIPGSSNGLQFLPFQTNLPGGGVGQKICLRAEFNFNNRKHCNAVFLGKLNSGGIARDSGGNTRDSGVNGRNDFFENTKIFFWLKWVRAEFGALGGILRFGQISFLNAFRLKLLPARRSRYIYFFLYMGIDLEVPIRSFNCESRACYVGNPRESFFFRFAKVTFFFAKVSRKLEMIIIA